MNVLGIRATPNSATFAVLDDSSPRVLNVEEIKIPNALSNPEALKFVRYAVLDILQEYHITKAALRIAESNAQRFNIRRTQIEAVIQEAFASSEVSSYFCGQISNISARVGFPRQDFKKYIDGTMPFAHVEGWQNHSKWEREAILVALGAINANHN